MNTRLLLGCNGVFQELIRVNSVNMLFPADFDLVIDPKVDDSKLHILLFVEVEPPKDQSFLVHRAELKAFALLANIL